MNKHTDLMDTLTAEELKLKDIRRPDKSLAKAETIPFRQARRDLPTKAGKVGVYGRFTK